MGGPDTAEIAVSGDSGSLADALTWLAHHVLILNDGGQPVWWGVVQAVSLRLDGVEYELDASEIVNCMAVVYTDEAGGQAASAWVEDAHSIARYGRRERRVTAQATTDATAQAQAARMVNERSAPMRSVKAAAGPNGAVLRCVGYWRTLDWRYWSRDGGQILQDESANTTELLGWSITSDEVGFNRPLLRIGTLGAVLHPLAKTDRIVASGSGSNSGVYEVTASDERTGVTTYTSDEISFDPSDDVHDDDGLFNQFRAGDLLQISGAVESGNNGAFWLKDMFQNGDGGYDHMRVKPGTIVDETAGATVTIAAGNSVGVSPRPAAWEIPGWTITLRAQALALAQAFTVSAAAAWELSEIWIQAARVGAPSDSLEVALCTDASGAPGTVVKQATITGADLPLTENMDWVQWTFDHALMLNPATTYWVVVSRPGSPDDDAYRVGLLEAAEDLSANSMLLWDGSNWAARSVASELDARLSLRIYGQRVTTSQISDIVLALGDWLNGISIRTASGLRTRLFRAAEDAQTALSEVKALLEFGTVGGERLLAQVSAERILVVDVQPPTSKTRYRWTAEGLRDRLGLPLTPGVLPVGEWVAFDALSAVDAFGPALLEAAEFDVGRGTVRPSFRGEQPVQTLARLTQPAALPDLAARLRPLLDARPATGRVSGAQSFTPPSQADYILSVDGGNCIAIHGMTGVIVASGANHAAIIQQAVNLAGVGGVLAFRAGDYNLDAPITPLNRQTWYTPFQAVFRPTGDNRILSAVDLDLFHLFGTFHIEDTSRNTTSAEAIYLDAAKNCQFQDIFVWDYYKGMTFSGVNGRTFECIFQSIRLLIMRHQGLCLWAEVGDNYFHSVFVKGPSTTEWSTGQGLVIGLYPSVGTVFGGIMFGRVEVLDCQVNVDLQGLYECWFDKILSDNAFGPAMYIGDNVQRLFVGTLWTAGSGDGLWIQGSDSNKCRRLFFNTIMSWINAQYGVIFRGKIEGVTIHTLYCLENQVCQVSYQGLENDNIVISNLTCEDSPAQGVDLDAGGAGSNCVIRTANLSGAVSALDMLAEIDGLRVDVGAFTARGVAVILSGQTSVTVTHGLEDKPKWVWATPYHAETVGAYVSNLGTTTFTITVPSATTADRQVAWHARSGRTPGAELLANPNVDTEGSPGEPADWYHSVAAGVEWATAEYVSAGHSLHIDGTGALHWWQSAAIFSIVPDEPYRLRVRIKGLGNNYTVVAIRWWNGGTFLIEDRILLNDNYTFWTERTADFIAPSGATAAEIAFKILADLSSDLKFDDVTFNETGQPNKITDASAEAGGSWAAATPGGTEWVSGDGHTGTRSLRVMPSATVDGEWKSNWFTVTGGDTYDAGCWVKGAASGNILFVVRYFSDAGGLNQISEDVREFPGVYASWTALTFSFTADVRAQSAEVRLRGGKVADVDIYADNFSFRRLE